MVTITLAAVAYFTLGRQAMGIVLLLGALRYTYRLLFGSLPWKWFFFDDK